MKLSLKQLGAVALVGGTFVLALAGEPSTEEILARRGPELDARLAAHEVQIDPAELFDLMHDRTIRLRILDVRDEGGWNYVQLLDSEHLRPDAVADWGRSLDFDEIVVVIDGDGRRSPDTWKTLQAVGAANSYLLDGGMDAWLERFGPQVRPSAALGDRHPAAWPQSHHEFEYTARVKRVGKAPKLSGGCG
jgi:rhodanese-related sulfurtransferase